MKIANFSTELMLSTPVAPSGKVTIDPPTHHCVLDVHIAEVSNKKLKVLEDFAQQKPADTAAVCDLIKNPNDTQQYVIKI